MMLRASSILVALAACGEVTSPQDDQPQWSIDHETDGALLGVWGTGPTDVWAVGGQTGRALVLHGNGKTWTPVEVDARATLFTAYGFTGTDVYAVGESGTIIHYDGNTWTRMESGTTQPLFGLWGATADDVWIVGGDVSGAPGSAVVLRGNRHGFTRVQDVPAGMMPRTLFKVHGFATDNVIMVGNDGVLRWDGAVWSRDEVPMVVPLFSTWGRDASDYYAVGGIDAGEILHSDGTQWRLAFELPIGAALRGVFATANEPTIAVGASSLVFEIDEQSTIAQAMLPELGTASFLHTVWGDGAGTIYVAGSNYPQVTKGLILRRDGR
jgi:hypothetical protein